MGNEQITLSASDTALERAEKIWGVTGMVNDRIGARYHIAQVIEIYMRLDAEAREKADG